jgi:hypothetical protein
VEVEPDDKLDKCHSQPDVDEQTSQMDSVMPEVGHFDRAYCSRREGIVLDSDWALMMQCSCIRHGVADFQGKLAAPSSTMDFRTGEYTAIVRQTRGNAKNYLLVKRQADVVEPTNWLKQLNDIVLVR